MLLHQGSAGLGGSAIDIEIQAERLERMKDLMMRLTAEHSGQPVAKVEQDARRDKWFTAEEARDYGLGRRGAHRRPGGRPDPSDGRVRRCAMSSYTIPSVIEKTVRGERAVDIYSRLLSDRIVYIGTEIDDGVANVVIAQLLHLEAENPDSQISIYLNSPGGSVTAMLGIYDTMQFVRAPVATTCIGQAASSAAVLLAAGAPGRRSVLPRSRVILHQPSGGGQGTLPDLAVQAKEIVRLRATMEEVLARAHRADPGAAPRGHGP